MLTCRLSEALKLPEQTKGFRRECICGADGGGVLVLDVAENLQSQRSVLHVVSGNATQYEIVLHDTLWADFVDLFPDGRVFVAIDICHNFRPFSYDVAHQSLSTDAGSAEYNVPLTYACSRAIRPGGGGC